MGKKKASIVYSSLLVLTYVWIIGAVVAGIMPVLALINLLTVPVAIKAIRGAMKPDDLSKLVPAMANNVMVVMVTQFLVGIGYVLAKVIS